MTRRGHSDPETLRIEVSEQPPPLRMTLYGEFDILAVDAVTRALEEILERGPDAVVIDLSRLDFMDSTGVRFLVKGREKARALGIELSLVPGGEPVRRVLTVSGVKALFEDPDGTLVQAHGSTDTVTGTPHGVNDRACRHPRLPPAAPHP